MKNGIPGAADGAVLANAQRKNIEDHKFERFESEELSISSIISFVPRDDP